MMGLGPISPYGIQSELDGKLTSMSKKDIETVFHLSNIIKDTKMTDVKRLIKKLFELGKYTVEEKDLLDVVAGYYHSELVRARIESKFDKEYNDVDDGTDYYEEGYVPRTAPRWMIPENNMTDPDNHSAIEKIWKAKLEKDKRIEHQKLLDYVTDPTEWNFGSSGGNVGVVRPPSGLNHVPNIPQSKVDRIIENVEQKKKKKEKLHIPNINDIGKLHFSWPFNKSKPITVTQKDENAPTSFDEKPLWKRIKLW